MRWLQPLTIILAVLTVATLGIAAWMTYGQQTKLAEENIELKQTKAALEQSVKNAREQTEALNDAVKGSKQYEEQQKQRALRAKQFIDGLHAAASVKVAVTEYFMSEGRWPDSNSAFGGAAPESYRANALQSIAVAPAGKIRMVFSSEGGKKEHIWLYATANAAGQVTWRCIAPDIPDINKLIPTCVHQTL